MSAILIFYFDVKWVNTPIWEYSFPSVANMLSSWCQYKSLRYISFPTQMLAKSFKIVPVMLVGSFLSNKKYDSYEYLTAIVIGMGVFLFISSSEKLVCINIFFYHLNSIFLETSIAEFSLFYHTVYTNTIHNL